MADSVVLDRGVRADPRLEITLRATRECQSIIGDVIESFLKAELDRRGCRSLLHDALFALQEAIGNVVRHAYRDRADAGPIHVRADVLPHLLQISVADEGPGYDPQGVPEPDFSRPLDGGFGLHLMRATMSKVAYMRRGRRNVLLMEKVLAAEASEDSG